MHKLLPSFFLLVGSPTVAAIYGADDRTGSVPSHLAEAVVMARGRLNQGTAFIVNRRYAGTAQHVVVTRDGLTDFTRLRIKGLGGRPSESRAVQPRWLNRSLTGEAIGHYCA